VSKQRECSSPRLVLKHAEGWRWPICKTEMSLRKWARDDNPVVYKNIIDADVIQYVLNPRFVLHASISVPDRKDL
jgi:hypothetical protein